MEIIFRFLKDETAATAIEYGLIAAGISLVIIAAVNGLGSKVNTKITAITYPFTTVNQSFYIVVTTHSGGLSQTPTPAIFTFTQAPP